MQFQQTHKNKKTQTDDDKMYDYFDQVGLVNNIMLIFLGTIGVSTEEGGP